MFLNKLIVVLICILGIEIFLVMIYFKFKINTISKEILTYLNQSMYSRVASLHKTNRKHEKWIQTLSNKMAAFEITGKVRKVDEKMNEITKDNCVLDEQELSILNAAFNDYKNACLGYNKNWGKMMADKISLKITKLNDWYKNTHLEKIEPEFAEFAEIEESE